MKIFIFSYIIKMLLNPFEIKKDLSINKSMKITLTSEKLKNKKSNVIELKVFLKLPYHIEDFEITLFASVKTNEKTKNLEFNFCDVLETIFSNFGQKFFNDYFLSYYMDNLEQVETEKNNIKSFNYFGEINLETIEKNKNLYFKIPKDNKIYLKLWQKIKKDRLMDPNYFEEKESEFANHLFQEINLDEEDDLGGKKTGKGSGRDKEKTIGYAIIKVCKWEKIRQRSYNNITLDDAAKCIGMAKKTLDDYKNQIKIGREKNFNFNKYYKFKMNVLKKFNKGEIKLE